MLLTMLFAILYVVFIAFLLVLCIYINDLICYFTEPEVYDLLLLRILLLLEVYEVYEDCNRKKQLGKENNGK